MVATLSSNAWSSAAHSAEQTLVARRAAQPASSLSTDVLNNMQDAIKIFTAQEYLDWKRKHPHAQRKTLANLVGHIDTAMKHAFHCSVEQRAQRGIPFEALIGWLICKCDKNAERIQDAKSILCVLAEDEHRVWRMQTILEQADDISEENMTPESRVDRMMLRQCFLLCRQEVDRKKEALKSLVKSPV